jgi:hypothetical protein
VMSDTQVFEESLDALYKAAKVAASFVETALTSKDTDFSPADKERLKAALSILKTTWSGEEEDDDDDSSERNK